MTKFFVLASIVWSGVALSSLAQSPNSASGSGATVSGEVTLTAQNSHRIERDASKVVVWLVPVQAFQPASARTGQKHYRLLQHNKRFDPGLLVVPVGSVVDFPNLDPWFHNVFSLYRGKRFDLGLYQAGSVRSVSFDRPGPSYLFCNIHPEMTGVVLAVNSEFFTVSDKSGKFSIFAVPPGQYVLHVWHENAAVSSLQSAQRTVEVGESNVALPGISILLNHHAGTDHKNKYGQDYDPDTLKTDY
jgi:plastocyanin